MRKSYARIAKMPTILVNIFPIGIEYYDKKE
jgi:hypothetical protein